jgi:2-iminoacetate synthase
LKRSNASEIEAASVVLRLKERYMKTTYKADFIDHDAIITALKNAAHEPHSRIDAILEKAALGRGLDFAEIAALAMMRDENQRIKLFATARKVKEHIYGKRLVFFAPIYISNLCANECSYCAFRVDNRQIKRKALTQREIAREVESLIDQGHKRVLLVAGESYPQQEFQYVLNSIKTVYATKKGRGEIRRVNVNIAPLTVDEFRSLKNENIGTYQIFQETYHRETYDQVHLKGKKRDYDYRITALHRAMDAGINDVGIGALLGLYDWKYELLAMMQHIADLEKTFGVGPHTISVPRIEPATGSSFAENPPHAVSDFDFMSIVAILRLAVPYTGIIMSTRESETVRKATFELGVSQLSAGSRTNPGGYCDNELTENDGQFALGDHRSLDVVVRDVAEMGYIPSFCTGCYRLGRTGADFMDLAKPGDIKAHCGPNAVSSFLEYLLDYGSIEARASGEREIGKIIEGMTGIAKERSIKMLARVRQGNRDVYC